MARLRDMSKRKLIRKVKRLRAKLVPIQLGTDSISVNGEVYYIPTKLLEHFDLVEKGTGQTRATVSRVAIDGLGAEAQRVQSELAELQAMSITAPGEGRKAFKSEYIYDIDYTYTDIK